MNIQVLSADLTMQDGGSVACWIISELAFTYAHSLKSSHYSD